MSEEVLPAGVRVALWGTTVLAGTSALAQLARRALPDVEECTGLLERVSLWRDLGEQAVFVALPRPGDVTGLPRGGPDLLAEATRAQECVFVAGVGGALVPSLETFGPPGDQGWIARWSAHDADPVPTHRIEALDLGQTERVLRGALGQATEELARAGAPPFGAAAEAGMARARVVRDGALAWGLPEGMPPRAVRVIDLAGRVLALADAGLDDRLTAVDASSTARRTVLLRGLQGQAATALADATNVVALHLAGWR